MAKYITQEGYESISVIEDDMRQVFHHPFNRNVYKNEIIKMKQAGSITEEDLAVAKLLFRFRFGTLEQIHEAVGSEKDIGAFYGRLQKLLQYRIINKFMLTFNHDEEIYKDSQMFYCLDIGGQHLLTHFSNAEEVLDWFYIHSIATSEIIANHLVVLETFNAFQRTCPHKISYFRPHPVLRVGTKTMVPAFEMALLHHGTPIYFLGEVFRKQEMSTVFRDKSQKWGQLLNTNTWRKYYGHDNDSSPILLAIAADDVTALTASKILYEAGDIKQFRVSTEERAKMPLYEKGAFLKYVSEHRQLREIRIRNFDPKD